MRDKSQAYYDLVEFKEVRLDFQRWNLMFQRMGLKPRRFLKDQAAVYLETLEGWFRLSLREYEKQELRWLRCMLEYLEERGFNNWAAPWQKTIIWEENSFCYLIQPWVFTDHHFAADDPAAIVRVAEVLAEFYRCGKDYSADRGAGFNRESWHQTQPEWENDLARLEQVNYHEIGEKQRKDFAELDKAVKQVLGEALNTWRISGINALHAHHPGSVMLCHGNLLTKHLIWHRNDYQFLNWEHLAFQPRIYDLAALIIDVAWWEPDWILYFITEYAKIQPFWTEEYQALMALLHYPGAAIKTLLDPEGIDYLERKKLKEVGKELNRRERCLAAVWKELGSQKRWAWAGGVTPGTDEPGKISMVCSPLESWGDFNGSLDSVIKVHDEQRLPQDVIERLTNSDQDHVLGGRDGNILEAASDLENHYFEIVEEQPRLPQEELEPFDDLIIETNDSITAESHETSSPVAPEITAQAKTAEVIRWSGFPTASKR